MRTVAALLLGAVLLSALAHTAFRGQDTEPLSLLPEAERMVGLRFDPSFFYDRGVTASELARQQVALWHEAGVDTVFFRVYDPAYGASYRTDYSFNIETDYGKQDLLRHVLRQAHARDMKVFAWLTPINHRGLWEAKPEWRALRPDGGYFKDESLPYPLCPRYQEVAKWWRHFVGDLLDSYPELDGIDVAEPVVSWREGEACYCRLCRDDFPAGEEGQSLGWSVYRSLPLVQLVSTILEEARLRGKDTVLTTVLPAGPEGKVLPFATLRDRTGLDLDLILDSPAAPDYLSLEFMWQEWAGVFKDEKTFHPGWAGDAFSQADRLVAGRARLLAHLEVTDFEGLTVEGKDLAAGLAAVLSAGAEGVEVYGASLMEQKRAWAALDGLEKITARRKVLLLYDGEGESDARQLATLGGHFEAQVVLKELANYRAGEIGTYDALFYLGMDAFTPVSEAFLSDVATTRIPVLWLNVNIEKLLSRTSRFGFVHVEHHRDESYDRVVYKNTFLRRNEPQINLVRVTAPEKVEVRAQALAGTRAIPYALRAGLLWYLADNPFSYAVEGGNYLVLADLLHEILRSEHREKAHALVRLEDVHPLTPPDRLRRATRILRERDIPFMVSLVPFYSHPGKGEFVPLSDRPELAAAVREAAASGGTVVLHGVTHQRSGESTTDYEFWDHLGDRPLEESTEDRTRARIMRGLAECRQNGIYPLLWETPHYAASLEDYGVISDIFRAATERRQSADKTGTDQLFPFVIEKDLFGQLLLPENLGYVPLDDQSPRPILANASRSRVVRDVTVGFFFHLFCDLDVLEKIVDGLAGAGFSFPDVRSLGLWVKGGDFHLSTTAAPFPADPPAAEAELIDGEGKVVWQGKPGNFPREKEPPRGIRVFAENTQSARSEPDDLLLPVKSNGGFRVAPLQVGIFSPRESFESLAAPFRAISAPCVHFDPDEEIWSPPAGLSLLVVSEQAASNLNPHLRLQILKFTASGGTLLTWGRHLLAQKAGILFAAQTRDVSRIVDLNYGTTVDLTEPRPVPVVTAEGNSYVLAEAGNSGTALLLAVDFDEGTLLYSALHPFGGQGEGPYPYFMSVLYSHCLLGPVVGTKGLEIYFDPGIRQDVAVEDLVKKWTRYGVRVIHAGAWHEYPEWTYEYDRLIELAHQNGMLVYAWLALPMVSPRFLEDHPEWQERNPAGDRTGVGWRDALSLIDPSCREEVKKWLKALITRFPFDGVNLAGLHFGGEEVGKPESLTPFHETARQDFAARHGFDPRMIWQEESEHYWKRSPESLDRFMSWRMEWTTRLHREFLAFLDGLSVSRRLSLTITTLDDAVLPEKARILGVDTRGLLGLRKEHTFRVQLMDAGRRPAGRERFSSLLENYGEHLAPDDVVLHLDLAHESPSGGGRPLTGLVLYSQISAVSPVPVALYSEDAVPEADWPFLSPSLASAATVAVSPRQGSIRVNSPLELRLALKSKPGHRPFLDGKEWPGRHLSGLIVPRGAHEVEFRPADGYDTEGTEIVDLSGTLVSVGKISRGLRFFTDSRDETWAVLNREILELRVDGESWPSGMPPGIRGYPVRLPAGSHEVVAITEGTMSFVFRASSVILSNGIILMSALSLLAVGLIFSLERARARLK